MCRDRRRRLLLVVLSGGALAAVGTKEIPLKALREVDAGGGPALWSGLNFGAGAAMITINDVAGDVRNNTIEVLTFVNPLIGQSDEIRRER